MKKLPAGIRLHKNEEGFPLAVSEKLIENTISSLESSRQAYDLNIAQGKQLNAAYNDSYKTGLKNVSRVNTMLYGFFGNNNPVVGDFGLKPFKSNKPGAKKAGT